MDDAVCLLDDVRRIPAGKLRAEPARRYRRKTPISV
jgi:hypothetical protein